MEIITAVEMARSAGFRRKGSAGGCGGSSSHGTSVVIAHRGFGRRSPSFVRWIPQSILRGHGEVSVGPLSFFCLGQCV